MIYFGKWKLTIIALVCLFGVAFSAPNFVSRDTAEAIPSWLPNQQISLGLDLQGGSHLLLEVDIQAVVKERLESLVNAIRDELRKARILYTGLGTKGNTVSVTIKSLDRLDEARDALRSIEGGVTMESGENGRLTFAFTEAAMVDLRSSIVSQSLEIIRRRIDETGVREPTIQRQGENRILVQLPGIEDPERMKDLIGKTAKLSFHLVDDKVSTAEALAGRTPPGSMLVPSADEVDSQGRARMYLVEKRAMVTGEMLVNAQPTVDQRSNSPAVSFRFDAAGGKRFGDVTSKNVGRFFAIVLDNKVISAPVIREAILGGTGIISGKFHGAVGTGFGVTAARGRIAGGVDHPRGTDGRSGPGGRFHRRGARSPASSDWRRSSCSWSWPTACSAFSPTWPSSSTSC